MRCSRARGLTLIEVVAALAILGTLLVGIVLAKSRHNDQLSRARSQTRVVDAADELITGWWTSSDGVPIGEQGELPGETPLYWQTFIVDNPDIAELGARVVRVELYDKPVGSSRSSQDNQPLVEVELVVPDPEVEQREQEEAEAAAQADRLTRGAGRDE